MGESYIGRARPVVLVVDDDAATRGLMRVWLRAAGFSVEEHEDGASAVRAVSGKHSAVCLDLGLVDMPGMEVLAHIRAKQPELPVVVITGDAALDTAVETMRAGAYDYLTKPLDSERVVHVVCRAVERYLLISHVQRLQTELEERTVLGAIIGDSPPMMELAAQVQRVVNSDVSVSIFGESGTGKELVARALHEGGERARRPFVALNCAAIPENLQESELFGHEKGAFTGAGAVRRGRFEQASGGTLFLDEVGEMSASTQAALLRTLQEKTIRRVGGTAEIPVNVRVVCATHRNLKAEVDASRFREDLYYRLVVFPIHVPPLRERRGDIPMLVAHFIQRFKDDVGRDVEGITPEAMDALLAHDWPGNVRELQNAVHRAMLGATGYQIDIGAMPTSLRQSCLPPLPQTPMSPLSELLTNAPPAVVPLATLERQAIRQALEAAAGSVGSAAKMLGIGRATLYRRLAKYEIIPS